MENAQKLKELLLQSKSQSSEDTPDIAAAIQHVLNELKQAVPLQKVIAETVMRTSRVAPIPYDRGDRTAKRSRWSVEVREHYTLGNGELRCAILPDIYRDTLTSMERWAKSLGWGSAFPAVAEHIIPEGQPTPAAMADIRVDDPANAIPLLKDLEQHYQAGHFAILPSGKNLDDGVEFKVYVSTAMRGQHIFYVKRTSDVREALPRDPRVFVLRQNGREQELLLGDLDGCRFRMRKAPSMRSLYQKAVMVYGESQKKHRGGIPNPEETVYYERFLRHCTRLGSLLTRALVHPESQ
ncbi:unnamed protein product, partial [Symbiodinium microadriaticum]